MRILLFLPLLLLAPLAGWAQNTVDLAEWSKKIEWSGDLRYRFNKAKESVDEERSYQQLRARLGLRADVNESTQAVMRLATGSGAISTNQTMGDSKDPGMARRTFGLDLGYIDWSFAKGGKIWAGRTPNPFWAPAKVQTLFDSDLAFEGMAVKWEPKWSSSSAFFNAGGFIISENFDSPYDVVDTGIVGAEAGYSHKTPAGTFTGRIGTLHYLNIQDKQINTVEKDSKVDAYSYPFDRYRGNTVYPNDPLAPPDQRKYYFQYKYVLRNVGLEWKHKFGPFEPTLFYEWITNTEVDGQNTAAEYGLSLKWGRTTLAWASVTKQSDSVVGAFTDSDSNGGGTDNKGTRTSAAYQLSDASSVALTRFQAMRGVDTVSRDFSWTQFDVVVNF